MKSRYAVVVLVIFNVFLATNFTDECVSFKYIICILFREKFDIRIIVRDTHYLNFTQFTVRTVIVIRLCIVQKRRLEKRMMYVRHV